MLQGIVLLGPWAWIIAGLILLGIELIVPGQVFLWLGVAALIVGIVDFIADPGWQAELILFGIMVVATAIIYRRYFRNRSEASDKPFLNLRSAALVGREFTLQEAIRHGQGKAKIGDTVWRVRGPDLPVESRVRVVSAEGAVLTVEAVES